MEVAELRSALLQSGMDARDAAELMQTFLMGRGYGVSPEAARTAAFTVEGSGCSLEVMQRELDRIAMVEKAKGIWKTSQRLETRAWD